MGEHKIQLVIIDDELSARIKVKKLLKDNDLYEIAAEFGDGLKAVEWLETHQADIILMDMNMPKINGVELIQMICALDEDVHFIAVSGYEDFEYVRGCLKNDRVSDYLLKHQMTKEGLIQALDDMQKRYAIQPHEANQEKDSAVRRIFEDENLSNEEIRKFSAMNHIHMEYADMVLFYLSPDMGTKGGQGTRSFRANVTMVLEDIVGQVIMGKHQYLIYRPHEKDIAVLISFANVKSYQYILNTETVMAKRIQKMAGRMLNITVTMWIGRIQSSPCEALSEYRLFRKRAQLKLYDRPGEIHLHTIEEKGASSGTWLLTEEEQKQLVHELLLCREEELYVHIKEIFTKISGSRCERKDVHYLCKKMLSVLDEACGSPDEPDSADDTGDIERAVSELEQMDFIGQYEEYIWNRYGQAVKKLQGSVEQKYDPVVAKAVSYINENFNRDITLETCTAHIGVSYTHMSRIFKKETGVKFTEYLNNVRVNHAKILIEQGKLSLKEIVGEAGFSNYNYFFKVFKESVGVSPSEYNRQSKNI